MKPFNFNSIFNDLQTQNSKLCVMSGNAIVPYIRGGEITFIQSNSLLGRRENSGREEKKNRNFVP
jgi:hypothetical protein